ncbi:MAG: histidinol-phosphate transaminase [Chloroflexota bacterium]|nr:histidinol-phosphate transaminase [Chloroflexota bacterium]
MISSNSSKGMEKFIMPHLAAMGSYAPPKPVETMGPVRRMIKMNANENPYGCSPKVLHALANCDFLNLYPDAMQTGLRQQFQEYTGIDAEHIVATCGGAGVVDLILRLLVGPGDEVINCEPTFDYFRFRTEICGGTSVQVLRDEKFAVDVNAVKAAIGERTKLIIVNNPNNPTGNITPQKDILELVDMGLPILVDEAYYEFSGETVAPLVGQYENLMVLRTLSKWAGLAGLRVGYGIFPTAIANYLLKIKPPFNVSAAALVAVQQSLADRDHLMNTVKILIAERERLIRELGRMNFLKPFPSHANYILCGVLKGTASEIRQRLEDKGILIRTYYTELLRNYIRPSVGKPEHNDALIKALKEIGEEIEG